MKKPELGTPDTPRIVYVHFWRNGDHYISPDYRPEIVSCVYDSVYIKAPRWLARLILKKTKIIKL